MESYCFTIDHSLFPAYLRQVSSAGTEQLEKGSATITGVLEKPETSKKDFMERVQ